MGKSVDLVTAFWLRRQGEDPILNEEDAHGEAPVFPSTDDEGEPVLDFCPRCNSYYCHCTK